MLNITVSGTSWEFNKCELFITIENRRGFPGGLDGKESSCNMTLGLIPCQEDTLEKRKAAHSSILAFDFVDHNKLWNILKEMGIPNHIICLLRNMYIWDKKQQVELGMEQKTSSILGKEYVKAVYCHPACLTFIQSTSHQVLGWMTHKLESRLPGEISTTSDVQMIPLQWQKVKRN